MNIGNLPDMPVPVRDVDQAAKEPFQQGTISTAFNGSSSSAEVITVPAGKRLMIEHFSAWINASGPNGLASVSIGIQGAGQFDQASCQQTGQTGNGLNGCGSFGASPTNSANHLDPSSSRSSVDISSAAGCLLSALSLLSPSTTRCQGRSQRRVRLHAMYC